MASLTATPATFAAMVATPRPGDLITLTPGAYGDQVIKRGEVHITGPKDAVFRTLSLQGGASGSSLDGFSVALTPDATTFSASTALKLVGTATGHIRNITLTNLTVSSGPATFGIDPASDPTVAGFAKAWAAVGQNVLGWPTGGGIGMGYAENITVRGCDVSGCDKGIGVGGTNITLDGNEIHHYRTSAIVGSPGAGLTITGNHIHDAHPWGWAAAGGAGDHGDYIHLWTVTGGVPIDGLRILGNVIEQGQGTPTLGIYLDDNGHGLGFTNLLIDRNAILNSNNQGIRLENAHGTVSGNVLLQAGAGIAPSIILAAGSDVALTGNIAADSQKLFATRPGNIAVPGGVQPPLVLEMARRMASK